LDEICGDGRKARPFLVSCLLAPYSGALERNGAANGSPVRLGSWTWRELPTTPHRPWLVISLSHRGHIQHGCFGHASGCVVPVYGLARGAAVASPWAV
jgi:hypothetical protein